MCSLLLHKNVLQSELITHMCQPFAQTFPKHNVFHTHKVRCYSKVFHLPKSTWICSLLVRMSQKRNILCYSSPSISTVVDIPNFYVLWWLSYRLKVFFSLFFTICLFKGMHFLSLENSKASFSLGCCCPLLS